MNNPIHMISRYLDDDLSNDELRIMIDWIEASDENADLFVTLCQLDSDLKDELGLLGQLATPQAPLQPASSESLVLSKVFLLLLNNKPAIKRWTFRAAVPAALIAATAIAWQVLTPTTTPSNALPPVPLAKRAPIPQLKTPSLLEPPAATVLRTLGTEPAFITGAKLTQGPFALHQGFAEIQLMHGVTVILQAPCQLDLVGDNQIYLNHGRLTAQVPPQATRFTVKTPSASLVDLGTRFGVDVHIDGGTTAAVFDGEVVAYDKEVELTPFSRDKQTLPPGQHLLAGDTTHATIQAGLDQAVTSLQPDHDFHPRWQDLTGRVQISGQARFFVQPPKDIGPDGFTDPNLIVFQEKTVELDSPLTVWTRLIEGDEQTTQATVAAGTKVISYMLHFKPGPKGGKIAATITFPGRVLGLGSKYKWLNDTNETLGLENVAYVDKSNKNYNYFLDRAPSDQFMITGQDQNILQIQLSTEDHSDQARVLIEVPKGLTDPSF